MRTLILPPLLLSGCVTGLDDIRQREIQDDVVTAKPSQDVRDCLVSTLAILRTPLETGTDQRKALVFSSPEAGAIFHYVLTAVDEGTRVEARRKNNIADGFNDARRCYQQMPS